MKSRKTAPAPASRPQWPTLTAVGLAAFCAGSLLTWWWIPPGAPRVEALKPPPIIAQQAALPPDISQLPPAEGALKMGNWHYDHQQWPESIERYQRAIELGMDNADVRTDLGNALRFAEAPKKALEQYLIARRQSPQHANSLFNLATLQVQAFNDTNQAEALCRQFLEQFPRNDGAAKIKAFLSELEERRVAQDSKLDQLLKGAAPKKLL